GNGSCVSCPNGTYSGAAGAFECTVCDEGAVCSDGIKHLCRVGSSPPTQSGAEAACCEAGTYKSRDGSGACEPCPAGTYCPLEATTSLVEALNCSDHSWSLAGSGSIQDCMCDPGYTGKNGRKCCSCLAGTYKEGTGSGWCVQCGAGTYSGRGMGSCTPCGEGKYSESVASVEETTCLSCPANSTSDAGSGSMAACECVLGYYGPSNTECGACEAGTYQDQRGHASCNDCDAGTYSPAFAAKSSEQCMACPADSDSPSGSVVQEACVCNAGFPGQDGGVCTACVAGTYQVGSGPGVCTPCEAGKYSSS
ncbi:hypothetical protein T484DRAFT_1599268, partial [Baffinella frigidus]